jgi:hypothetical protein
MIMTLGTLLNSFFSNSNEACPVTYHVMNENGLPLSPEVAALVSIKSNRLVINQNKYTEPVNLVM